MTVESLDEITEAEADVAAAESDVAAVEERILKGDHTATAAELVDVEERLNKRRGVLARAREIRQRREEREAERARLARIAELRETIATMFGAHDAELLALFDSAVESLGPLVLAVDARNRGVRDLTDVLLHDDLAPLPEDLDPRRSSLGSATITVRLPKVDERLQSVSPHVGFEPIQVTQLLLEAVYRALDANGQERAAGKLASEAGISHDRHQALHVGLVEPLPDGASSSGRQGPAVGLSDRLRRSAALAHLVTGV